MQNVMWAALATGFLMAGSTVATASDTIRLGGPSAIQSAGNTELVHGRRYYGHHHGYYGRSYYGGYYRPSYYASYYRPLVYASYYRPYVYSSYYYTPYYSSSYYYYPIAGDTVSPPATTLQSYYQAPQSSVPMPPASNGNGTYQYDGGPRSVIPMPTETNPANTPRSIIPTDGRLVSLPTETTGGTSQVSTLPTLTRAKTGTPRVSYPAYGE